jgi:hypothetical protein
MQNKSTPFEQHLREALPVNSSLRRLLGRVRMDLNELLWTIKPGWPQLGEPPEFERLRHIAGASTRPVINPEGRRILIFSMRAWRIHNVWEGLIGRGLLERGADVKVVICDGLPRCDMFDLNKPGYSAHYCQGCFSRTRQLFHLFGLPTHHVSDFLELSDRDEAKKLVAAWSKDYRSFVAEDLPLGELVRPSVARTLLRGFPEEDPLSAQLYREYLEGGILLARMFRRMLDAFKPDTMMMINGLFFAEHIGMTIAKERQLHTVTHERSFMWNRLILDHDEAAAYSVGARAWPELKDRPLTVEEETELDEYLRSREVGKNEVSNFWPSAEVRREFIVHQLQLDPNKPILAVFTNVLWDTALYRCNVAFNSMFEWLEHTIHQASKLPMLQMVIRIHPGEVCLPEYQARDPVLKQLVPRFPTLPENAVIVPPESNISSYVLLDLSVAASVYVSTIGLEAVLRGIPTIVAGKVHYRNKGFTYDVESPDHYSALLKESPTWQRSSIETVSLAKRYAHLFFLRNPLPLDLVTEFEDYSVRFNIESFDNLKPNRHKVLDHICSAILERKSFVQM